MLSREEFINMSIMENLFFARIMKEHLIFVDATLPIVNCSLILEVENFKNILENYLLETIILSGGMVDDKAINSNELVTNYTLSAEEITNSYTGICINTELTKLEMNLVPIKEPCYSPDLENRVYELNNRGINLVTELIKMKENLHDNVDKCQIFIFLYPHLLEHVIEEAETYLNILNALQARDEVVLKNELLQKEVFWNDIMKEHSEFIRGLLDPTEKNLFNTANDFADLFEKLTEEAKKVLENNLPIDEITEKSKMATESIIQFKTSAVNGLINCQIKAIILPLLADHVLREANHYNRLLNTLSEC
ncbi:DUF2935 domain-containing protein [Anaerosalibacter sp. Marseille-P3206]|uniref:DUF2935 domain-containing protein n=1 Tax=Anaerosalibacter sp. Marseille-P3206 TaxID=1871005 RepID=UPI0009869981|nr:DUF2935 domain-containing protein [Anaerosalibacter sp. Marseille-P3206]